MVFEVQFVECFAALQCMRVVQ